MTYAKMKAARPANATMATEPWTLEAAPVAYTDGVAVAVGALCGCQNLVAREHVPGLTYVTLWEYERTPVADGAGE